MCIYSGVLYTFWVYNDIQLAVIDITAIYRTQFRKKTRQTYSNIILLLPVFRFHFSEQIALL